MRSVPLHDVNEIQQIFEQSDLDAVVILSPRNLWCLTGAARAFARRPGYRRNACAIAFRNAPPLLISGRFQEEPSQIFAWIRDITTYSDYLESPLARAAEVLVKRGLGAGKIGVEARAHTTEFYDDLVAGLDNAELVPCDDLLEAVWTVKQPKEIELLNKNLQKLSDAIRTALDQSRAGETEIAVHKRILGEMMRTGTTNVWGNFVSGERLPLLNGLPSSRTLLPGDLFRIDYSYAPNNYPARICRIGVVGDASHEQHDAYGKFTSAVANEVERIAAGQTGQQIFKQLTDALASAGFTPAAPSFGNGLGVGMNLERPIIHAEELFETRPGMVLSLEPAVSVGYKANLEIQITEAGNQRLLPKSLPQFSEFLAISSESL